MLRDFFDMTRPQVESELAAEGYSAAHAKELFRRAYKDLALAPWIGPTYPRALPAAWGARLTAVGLTAASERRSSYDGSVKFLVALEGGGQVESVLMPEKKRVTLCVSTQVGCAQGCVFCHTGRMGLTRHLRTGEIVGQIVLANRFIAAHPEFLEAARLPADARVTNVVFMGMGEPLDNVDAVIDSVRIMTDPLGLGLGPSHVSISTAGHLDGLERLYAALPGARVALSVHSPDEAKRSKIMPINRRWPLSRLVARLAELIGPHGHPPLLQYTLIADVNDSAEEADALADLALRLRAKVNVIPLNEVAVSRLAAPVPQRVQAFRDVLHRRGVRVMVRYSKGQDIAAACGQLVTAASARRAPAASGVTAPSPA